MSECVVRMEMPRDGLCDLAFSFLDGTFCTIEGNRCNYCDDGAIPNWCPIICSLPEGHGRLVDADAYSAEMKDRQDAAWKWAEQAKVEEDEVKQARAEGAFTAFVEAKLTWDEQATIVPAGRSET